MQAFDLPVQHVHARWLTRVLAPDAKRGPNYLALLGEFPSPRNRLQLPACPELEWPMLKQALGLQQPSSDHPSVPEVRRSPSADSQLAAARTKESKHRPAAKPSHMPEGKPTNRNGMVSI